MRAYWNWFLIPLTILGSGCGLVQRGAQVLTHRTSQRISDYRERQRNLRWAKQAWAEVQQQSPSAHFSGDYALGFQKGFTEHLYWGGNGEPPVLPPHKYRDLKYQSPQGYTAIQDWFRGYRHGVLVVQQRGYRQWVTGPSSLLADPQMPDTPVGSPALSPVVPEAEILGVVPQEGYGPSEPSVELLEASPEK